jgi:hypothetical protein
MSDQLQKKITLEDIESKIRGIDKQISGTVKQYSEGAGKTGAISIVGIGVLIILAYLMGRKSGRLKSTFVEIRRK